MGLGFRNFTATILESWMENHRETHKEKKHGECGFMGIIFWCLKPNQNTTHLRVKGLGGVGV